MTSSSVITDTFHIKAVYLVWGLTNSTTAYKIPLTSLSFAVMISQEKTLECYSTPTQPDN